VIHDEDGAASLVPLLRFDSAQVSTPRPGFSSASTSGDYLAIRIEAQELVGLCRAAPIRS
jgi:hypothetical protein